MCRFEDFIFGSAFFVGRILPETQSVVSLHLLMLQACGLWRLSGYQQLNLLQRFRCRTGHKRHACGSKRDL